jgi:hypothetical protein
MLSDAFRLISEGRAGRVQLVYRFSTTVVVVTGVR